MKRKHVSSDPNSLLQKLDGETMKKMKANTKRPAPRRPADSLGKVSKNGKPAAPKRKAGAVKVETVVYQGEKALTVEQAKELIGWKIVGYAPKKGSAEKPEDALHKFHLRDTDGNKVFLVNNATNRPIRPGLYKRYISEVLRSKWYLNGETIVFDENGMCTNGQHRLIAFVLAEEIRRKDPKRYAKYGWGGPGTKSELRMEVIVVRGISSAPEVLDTQNLGQKQTGGDVIYRRDFFKDEIDSKRRKLSNILSGATRLVWLRCTNRKVSDAPHFPPSEMLDFIEDHPKLIEYARYIADLDTKSKTGAITKGGSAGGGITLSYATGLCYVMSASATDPDEWREKGVAGMNFKMEAKAKKFWEKFASPTNIGATDPIYNLLQLLPGIDTGSAEGRDELVGMVIKAFNAFADGVEVEQKDLQVRRMRDKKTGEESLAEDPRLGGIDTEGRPEHADEASEDIKKVEETREGSKAGKQWAEGDECWVRDKDGDHWFGTIQEVIKHDDKTMSALIVDADSGTEYQEQFVSLKNGKARENGKLSLSYPGA